MSNGRRRSDRAAPVDSDRVPLKAQLVRVGTLLFAENGFDGTTVQEIVERAGATKGAFYHHFTAKEELLFEIHNEIITTELRDAEVIIAQNLPTAACLRQLIVNLIESIALYQPGVTVFFREMHRLPTQRWSQVLDARNRYFELYAEVIARGQADGLFRSDMNPRLVTLALFGTCNWFHTWYNPRGTWSAHELGQQIAGIYLSALEARRGDSLAGRGARKDPLFP